MRRLFRWMFNAPAALSLLLCLLTKAILLRTQPRSDADYERAGGIILVTWCVGFLVMGLVAPKRRRTNITAFAVLLGVPLGIWLDDAGSGEGPSCGWLGVPLQLLIVGFLANLVRSGFVRLWHRNGSVRCVACGYDLRATPDRCPECGTLTPLRS